MAMGDPQGCYDLLMRNNPQFRQFVNDNQGKSPQQIAEENGINLTNILK